MYYIKVKVLQFLGAVAVASVVHVYKVFPFLVKTK